MNKSTFIIFLSFTVLLMYRSADGQTLHGQVYEMNDMNVKAPLPGANIYWEGTTEGTASDEDGHFHLDKPKNGSRLVVSYIGYESDTIEVGKKLESLEVVLSQNKTLSEVEIASRASGAHVSRAEPLLTQQITIGELKKAACCNLSESFETNASVDVNYSDAITGAKQIKLLGLAGKYSQIQTENVPNLRGLGSSYGLGYIPGSWMESIQVSKGTASVKNGYESITGQINVEYKKPDNGEKFFLNLYGNSMSRLEGNINSSIKLGGHWSTTVLAHASNQSVKIDHNKDTFLDETLFNQVNFMNRWRYESHRFHADFGAKYLNEERWGGQVDFQKGTERTTEDPYGTHVKTNRLEAFSKTAFLFPDKEVMNLAWINSYIYHDMQSFFGLNDYNATEHNFYSNLMYQSFISNTQNTFTTGLSYVFDQYSEVLNDSAYTRTEHVPGAFFEYTYILPEKFTLLIGIRGDYHNIDGFFFTPRVHMKYDIDSHTTLRVSAGKGYRKSNVIAENLSLLTTSRQFTFREKLNMEQAWNYGISLTRYFDILGKELVISGEYFRTDFINQVIVDKEADNTHIYFYNLDGKSFANTIQVEAKYELIAGLDVIAAFRLNDVKMTINEELMREPLVNRYKGLLSLSYMTKLKKWQFDFTAQFNGTSRVPSTDLNPEQYRRPDQSPTYTILNAQITKFFKRWDLYIGGENLTNYKQHDPIIAVDDPYGPYFDASNIWGPVSGIKIYAGLRYTIK